AVNALVRRRCHDSVRLLCGGWKASKSGDPDHPTRTPPARKIASSRGFNMLFYFQNVANATLTDARLSSSLLVYSHQCLEQRKPRLKKQSPPAGDARLRIFPRRAGSTPAK